MAAGEEVEDNMVSNSQHTAGKVLGFFMEYYNSTPCLAPGYAEQGVLHTGCAGHEAAKLIRPTCEDDGPPQGNGFRAHTCIARGLGGWVCKQLVAATHE